MKINVNFSENDMRIMPDFGDSILRVGENLLKYATVCTMIFADAQFPPGFEMVADLPNAPIDMSSMFRRATGIKKLVFKNVPISNVYNVSFFFYGTTAIKPTIEEIALPDGIKFSDFGRFAGYCGFLKTVTGRIDLSECTVTQYCFYHCSALEEVRFMPNTIGVSIEFTQSPNLSEASLDSIAEGLATVSTTQTLKLHATAKDKLTDKQKATITQKGWSIA